MKKAADTVIDCLKEKGMSQRQLAARMGEDVRHLNQQLNRQKDMKVERFADVMDHIGYRVEIIENDGVCKVSSVFAKYIIENREPKGLFWLQEGDVYIGIDNSTGDAWTEEFATQEECFDWLKNKSEPEIENKSETE